MSHCEYYEPAEIRTLCPADRSFTSYFHINCRSLSADWQTLTDLLSEMHTDNFSFDFIGLSEVFNVERDQRLYLPGYQDIVYRTRDDGGGGGVVSDYLSKRIYPSGSDMI